ncbi:serine hydrolase [Kutzneria buriramensis]|uniref:D-alanyl-D-alanine carboxypeptidase n=1 Tax=Kutzneria buriramensis TaxID=1045776 RepID=A0A3E0GY86_9PSEU|nr:serine hydrolase domain-containing protein [Kutzneria buriramensis]REH34937.1 D-alanyl-D-alanine carboxypeptidase [Kutzneria buriramensis]
MPFRKPNQALAAVLLTLTTGLAQAAPAVADTGTLQQQVDAIHDTAVVGVLASVTAGHGSRSARAGVADTATGSPVPLDAEFRIGSVTKTFVATVVLQLVGEGRLSLDDTVARWLPGVVEGSGNDGAGITIRELLEHTSGIHDYVDDLPGLASTAGFRADRFRTYAPEQLVALAMRHPPVFLPGAGASYSNTNYILAGMIINRVTGRSWAHEVDARIIRPLGLSHTTTPGAFPFVLGPHAEGYSNFGAGDPIDVTVANPSMFDAAGSMISTAGDLSRFLAALVGGRLLAPAQLAAMETTIVAPQLEALWPGARYGLGLGWFPLSCGGGYFGHPGDVPGYHTWDAISPRAGRTVVVLATGDGDERTQQATNALVDEQLCAAAR